MIQNTMLVCVVVLFIAWYYYQRFQDSEREYYRLHKRFRDVVSDNVRMKARVKDLQSYKNDVSKTFRILDNELLMINDHIKKQSANVTLPGQSRASRLFSWRDRELTNNTRVSFLTSDVDSRFPQNRVSILTPDVLSSLFTNMNQERINVNEVTGTTGTTGTTLNSTSVGVSTTGTNGANGTNGAIDTTTGRTGISNETQMNTGAVGDVENVDTGARGIDRPLAITSVTYDISYTPGDIFSRDYEQYLINNETSGKI